MRHVSVLRAAQSRYICMHMGIGRKKMSKRGFVGSGRIFGASLWRFELEQSAGQEDGLPQAMDDMTSSRTEWIVVAYAGWNASFLTLTKLCTRTQKRVLQNPE